MGQWVTAIINMEMKRMSSDAIDKMASGLRSTVSGMEKVGDLLVSFSCKGRYDRWIIWRFGHLMLAYHS